MAFCGICKEKKREKNKWIIQEHAVDNSVMRSFKLCDGCGGEIVRNVLKQMARNGIIPERIDLGKTGLVESIFLGQDNSLEVTLSMDLAKARKMVLDRVD